MLKSMPILTKPYKKGIHLFLLLISSNIETVLQIAKIKYDNNHVKAIQDALFTDIEDYWHKNPNNYFITILSKMMYIPTPKVSTSDAFIAMKLIHQLRNNDK